MDRWPAGARDVRGTGRPSPDWYREQNWPAPASPPASECSSEEIPRDRLAEAHESDQTLQPGVLDLEVLQPPRSLALHPPVLVPPAVERRLADPPSHREAMQNLSRRTTACAHRLGLAKRVDHLLGRVSCPCHRGSPGPNRDPMGISWRV